MLRKSMLLTLSLITSLNLLAETKVPDSSIVLKGRISNCSDTSIHMEYKDRNYNTIDIDIKLDAAGNFYKSINGVKFAQRVRFGGQNASLTLLIAPGYNLEITGDGKDKASFLKSYVIKGIGAGSNLFTKQLDSISVANNNNKNIYELPKDEFLPYLYSKLKVVDSLATAFFNGKNADRYANDFKQEILFENDVMKLYFSTYYVLAFKLRKDEAVALINSTLNESLMRSLFEDYNLRSDIYLLTMKTNYLEYLSYVHSAADTLLKIRNAPEFHLVSANYKGKVKELVLLSLFLSKIHGAVVFENLASVEDSLTRYARSFTNETYVDSIKKQLSQKQSFLAKTKIGQPAPSFSLQSAEGKVFKLEDFLGKVVYIDLWASWCGPCREESPFLRKIYDQFKDNKGIAFIGISIKDDKADWMKAIKEDKPAWLQLIDNNDMVFNLYTAISIPRFIIIDKKGNIVSIDAPRPSEGSKLLSILNSELDK